MDLFLKFILSVYIVSLFHTTYALIKDGFLRSQWRQSKFSSVLLLGLLIVISPYTFTRTVVEGLRDRLPKISLFTYITLVAMVITVIFGSIFAIVISSH